MDPEDKALGDETLSPQLQRLGENEYAQDTVVHGSHNACLPYSRFIPILREGGRKARRTVSVESRRTKKTTKTTPPPRKTDRDKAQTNKIRLTRKAVIRIMFANRGKLSTVYRSRQRITRDDKFKDQSLRFSPGGGGALETNEQIAQLPVKGSKLGTGRELMMT